MKDVVILSAARTPIGSFLGTLSSVPAPRLGAVALRAALGRAGVEPAAIDHVIMGNVVQAGIGQAPARQAMIYAGLETKTGAITLNKVCGSGLWAVVDASRGVRLGEWDMVLAGGQESMSLAPHLLERSRAGFRMGPFQVQDAMIKDGLWDPYGDKHMGMCGELCASEYGIGREEQDAYALESYQRARKAIGAGQFDDEIEPVDVPQRKGDPVKVDKDEEPFAAPLEKMAKLRPAFTKDGTITAANASKINDGAAAVLVASAEAAEKAGRRPLARILAHGTVAQEPEWFTTAPIGAAKQALERAGLEAGAIDRWEINEAFSVVAMVAMRELGLDHAKVNVRGGAVALGHPIGCSGARILTTLVHQLLSEQLRYGCASICLGGGEAAALVIENLTL